MNKHIIVWMVLLVSIGVWGCKDEDNSGSDADSDTDSDADSDSDGDSDSDADGDFPGDCKCAARYTIAGQLVDICSDIETCGFRVDTVLDQMNCYVNEGENIFKLNYIPLSYIGPGASFSNFRSSMSLMTMVADGESYSPNKFDLQIDEWDGVGGIASGTFTAVVSDDPGAEVEVTDGKFYGPIRADK